MPKEEEHSDRHISILYSKCQDNRAGLENHKMRLDQHDERTTQNEKMIQGVNDGQKTMEKWISEAHVCIYGNADQQRRGLMKTVAYIERGLTWFCIGGCILWVLFQNLDKLSKIFKAI